MGRDGHMHSGRGVHMFGGMVAGSCRMFFLPKISFFTETSAKAPIMHSAGSSALDEMWYASTLEACTLLFDLVDDHVNTPRGFFLL